MLLLHKALFLAITFLESFQQALGCPSCFLEAHIYHFCLAGRCSFNIVLRVLVLFQLEKLEAEQRMEESLTARKPKPKTK